MPKLMWTGRGKVVNYHKKVPFRFLDFKYNFGEASENKIIHGDNLEVLKSLLPYYEGKIKCIYIDPPYNTGNEGWIYNDNVNDPQIQKWLNQVVGKEGEDFNRHDKWLCMMYPRLRLLQKLLSDDGAIFISIDDNELFNLKFICDEIFGASNFLGSIVWEKSDSPKMDSKYFSGSHDFIIAYGKNIDNLIINKIFSEEIPEHYNKVDENGRKYYLKPMRVMGGNVSESLYYPMIAPDGTEVLPISSKGEKTCWRWSKKKVAEESNRIEWVKSKNGWSLYFRIYADTRRGTPPMTVWHHQEVGSNRNSKAEIKNIFGENLFDTPKPTALIEKILQLATDKNSIVLDSFAGSGTTAHAVINLNQQDGGNRKFILIESMDYCENITAERIRRVGGNFNYYELGEPLFINKELNPKIELKRIREYIYYSETRQPLEVDDEYYLGTYNDTAYYFCYNHDENIILDRNLIDKLKDNATKKVIYASACNLSGKILFDKNITFKKIQRDIMEF